MNAASVENVINQVLNQVMAQTQTGKDLSGYAELLRALLELLNYYTKVQK